MGAVDAHVHCCPHINDRTVTVFDAVREAAAAGLRGIGLMDLFANSSGMASLAMEELGDLGVDVFGGVVLEPYAGGLSPRVVETALKLGYGPTRGAVFVALPFHHTEFTARLEHRSQAYIDDCLTIPAANPLPDSLLAILDLVAEADVVLNTGHVSGVEAVRVFEVARSRGVRRMLAPASYFAVEEARAVVEVGALCEFSFFVMSHATQVAQTMVDSERHRAQLVTLDSVGELIHAIGPANTVLSSDSGAYVLPPPVEAFREFLVMIQSLGFSDDEMRLMTASNPAALFLERCGPTDVV
jgi:hypothetical protein